MYDILWAVLSWLADWWWAVILGWLSLAAIVGLVVGRVIRNRDRQEPKPLPWEAWSHEDWKNQGMQGMSPGSEKTPEGPASGA